MVPAAAAEVQCSKGCRFRGDAGAIETLPETYATIAYGGSKLIAKQIEEMEESVKRLSEERRSKRAGEEGYCMWEHCMLLWCRGCKRFTVVSWKHYNENQQRIRAEAAMAGKVKKEVVEIESVLDYYRFVVSTFDLHQTGEVKWSDDVPVVVEEEDDE